MEARNGGGDGGSDEGGGVRGRGGKGKVLGEMKGWGEVKGRKTMGRRGD